MKAYLEGASIFRQEKEKVKVKGRRENSRGKEPSPCYVGKIKLHGESGCDQLASDQRRKYHQRVKTELAERKSNKMEANQPLNKTQSKTRLKTEIGSYSSHTIKLNQNQVQKGVQVESNPLWGIVKERLNNQSKTRRNQNQHPVVKKLIQLTQRAKLKDGSRLSKNPEEIPARRQLHKSMEVHVHNLKQQIAKENKGGRELGLCQVLKEMVSYANTVSNGIEHRESKLLTKVKELEGRNIRLLELMNKLKREGVDVDSFWTGQE